jgi:hypothetical protein
MWESSCPLPDVEKPSLEAAAMCVSGSCQRRKDWPSPPHVAKTGVGRGMSFASFLRFWAVAANRNSSLAPLAEAQSVEPEDAFQMSEQHLDLLSFAT